MIKPKEIFVFGSNLAGRHGAGAARHAMLHKGAEYGVGYGPTGNSFAIPTKDENIKTLPLNKIEKYVSSFVRYATLNPDIIFEVTRIGCGLAGYTDDEIAPLFVGAPPNAKLPVGWRAILEQKKRV